jgi:hypothetical protein
MRNKKAEKPDELNPEQQLEAKVDAMMDVSTEQQTAPAPVAQKPEPAKTKDELPPLDIFSDPSTAPDVPKDLLKQLDKSDISEEDDKTQVSEKPAIQIDVSVEKADPSLDDAVSDAAIDDIVAQESDTTLANEDTERAEAAAVTEPVEKVPKIHHHPIFWTIIFLIALVAMISAYWLITGGSNLPGSGIVQGWLGK